MEFSSYFHSLNSDRFNVFKDQRNVLGGVIEKYRDPERFPDFSGFDIAIIGVEEDRGAVLNDGCGRAPDIIREKLYSLKTARYPYKIVDLGNIRLGETLTDTYAALSAIHVELFKEGVLPVILGGSQDLTFAQYVVYQKLEETVNIVSVESKFDLVTTGEPNNADSYLG